MCYKEVVYMCFIFYCIQHIFGSTGWCHTCIWKKRELVIWDWYFSGRMETINMKKKGNERKKCRFITLFLVFVHLPINCVYTWFWNSISTFFFLLPFFYVLIISILPLKYQSQMTNSLIFSNACVRSSR